VRIAELPLPTTCPGRGAGTPHVPPETLPARSAAGDSIPPDDIDKKRAPAAAGSLSSSHPVDAPPNQESDASSAGEIRPPAPPPRKNGLAFFAIVLALYGLLWTLAQVASPLLGLAWSEVFALLLPAFVAAAGSNLYPTRALLLSRRPGASAVALALFIGAAGFLAAGAIMELTSIALPARWLQLFDVSKLFERPPLERAALSVAAATVAPFCEEVAFRGWLLTALRTRCRTGPAIALSAILFAVMHLDPVRFSALVALGVLYAWMTWRSGSVWPAILAHATNNVLGIALTTSDAGTSLGAPRPLTAQFVGSVVLTLALSGGVLSLLAMAYRRVTPAPPPIGDALVRRDPAEESTAFHFARVPAGQLAAIGAAGFSLAALLLTHRR
jgi:membrane protease YdiL (CAAX protease family)